MSWHIIIMNKRRIDLPVKKIVEFIFRMIGRHAFHDLIGHRADTLETVCDQVTGINGDAHVLKSVSAKMSISLKPMNEAKKTDVLIVGSGIAGLTCAIKIASARSDIKVTVMSKSAREESNTRYAQGGIAAVWNQREDTHEKHIADTLDAGD